MKLNPFTRELIQNALAGISDSMIVSVMRTSRSTIVKNNLDFSSSICDSHGRQTAQGLALPGHLGSTMPALKGCLDYFGDDIHPGDMLASNPSAAGAASNDNVLALALLHCAAAAGGHRRDMPPYYPGSNPWDPKIIVRTVLGRR